MGGDEDSDGIGNDVYDNKIYNNLGYGIKILRPKQGTICGNVLEKNTLGLIGGDFGGDYYPLKTCEIRN